MGFGWGTGNLVELVCGRERVRKKEIVLFWADVDFYIVVG